MEYQKKKIEKYPNYSIDTLCQFRNDKTNKILKQYRSSTGYYYLNLCNEKGKERFFTHITIAKNFKENYFAGCHVHHKDGNKCNNSPDNIECITEKEHRELHVMFADIPVNQWDMNGCFIKRWISMSDAGRELGIDFKGISACIRRKQKSAFGFLWTKEGESNPTIQYCYRG